MHLPLNCNFIGVDFNASFFNSNSVENHGKPIEAKAENCDLRRKFLSNGVYRATMWFLSRMSTEMNDQHVLGLERLLFTSTIFPLANEAFLIGTHMLIIQMLKERNNHEF